MYPAAREGVRSLQHTATQRNALQHTATRCNTLQKCDAKGANTPVTQYVDCCSVLQRIAVR